MKKLSIILVLVAVLAGCATMPTPQTPGQKVAYAKATLTGLTNGVADLLRQDVITVEDAKAYREYVIEARTLLDTAEFYLKGGEERKAMDTWQKANEVLLMLNNYLLAKERKKEYEEKERAK